MEESYYVDWVKVCWNKNFYDRCKKIFPIRVYGASRFSIKSCAIDLSKGYAELTDSGGLLVNNGENDLPSIYSIVYLEIPKEVREIFTDLKDYVEQKDPTGWIDGEDFWEEYKYQY